MINLLFITYSTAERRSRMDPSVSLLYCTRRERRGQQPNPFCSPSSSSSSSLHPQALYELVKCNFNAEEALRRLRFNVKVFSGKHPPAVQQLFSLDATELVIHCKTKLYLFNWKKTGKTC